MRARPQQSRKVVAAWVEMRVVPTVLASILAVPKDLVAAAMQGPQDALTQGQMVQAGTNLGGGAVVARTDGGWRQNPEVAAEPGHSTRDSLAGAKEPKVTLARVR